MQLLLEELCSKYQSSYVEFHSPLPFLTLLQGKALSEKRWRAWKEWEEVYT